MFLFVGIFIALLLRYDAFRATKGKTRVPKGPWSKPYFISTFVGYILGLATTIFVMHTFQVCFFILILTHLLKSAACSTCFIIFSPRMYRIFFSHCLGTWRCPGSFEFFRGGSRDKGQRFEKMIFLTIKSLYCLNVIIENLAIWMSNSIFAGHTHGSVHSLDIDCRQNSEEIYKVMDMIVHGWEFVNDLNPFSFYCKILFYFNFLTFSIYLIAMVLGGINSSNY